MFKLCRRSVFSPYNFRQQLDISVPAYQCTHAGTLGLVQFIMSLNRKKECRWVWKNIVDLKEPKADIRTAFRVVIDNNWQGIAYLMLEVAGLDFVEAIQVK